MSHSVGTLTLHRFNGDEIFTISEAVIRAFAQEDGVVVDFEINTDGPPVQTLPDTEDLCAKPSGEWQVTVPSFSPDTLAGKTFSIPQDDGEDGDESRTNFYYVEHEAMDDVEIAVSGREGDGYRVQITGQVTDVNYYDGSKPPTKVVVDAVFRLEKTKG